MTRPEPELLRSPIVIAGVERQIVRRAGTDDSPILRIAGVDTREAAEALRGEPILVDRPPLGEDEFWTDDLVGCDVVDGVVRVGAVERVLSYPSCEVLVVGDLLIPLVDDAVRSIDVGARRIDVSLEFLGEG